MPSLSYVGIVDMSSTLARIIHQNACPSLGVRRAAQVSTPLFWPTQETRSLAFGRLLPYGTETTKTFMAREFLRLFESIGLHWGKYHLTSYYFVRNEGSLKKS